VPADEDRDISVLVVGPDARRAARLLRSGPFRARAARDSHQASTLLGLAPDTYDAVLYLPTCAEVDAHVAVRRLRLGTGDALVLVLLPSDHRDDDVVRLFDAGADDVLTGPLSPVVLAARLRARRRRTNASDEAGQMNGWLGDLVVDRAARRCLIREREVTLRAKELDLLDALVAQAGHVVSRSMLMSVVWDEHWFRSTKTLDVTMVGLRRRLREAAEAAGALVPEIMTIRGVGYRLDPPGKIDLARAR
jgi:DNA-binding response OmpR family regulator